MSPLSDQRILLVGASSGIGRATALLLSAQGARVAMAARRRERLEEAVAAAESKCIAVQCDVREPADCEQVVERTVREFGGIDAIVYATGIARPVPLADVDATEWRLSLETNLMGSALVTRAAIPHLVASRGKAVFFSSIAGSEVPPRPNMALYCVTKRALDVLVTCWQQEHREVSFTSIMIGDTVSEFGAGWGPEQFAYVKGWGETGYLFSPPMEPECVAQQVVSVLASSAAVSSLRIVPRYAEAMDPPD